MNEKESKAQEMPTTQHPSASEAAKENEAFKDAIRSRFPKEIKTIDGDPIKIKPISWGKRTLALDIVAKVYETVMKSEGENTSFTFVQANRNMMIECPEYVAELAAIAVEKDAEWVNKNLEDVVALEIVNPFFESSILIKDAMMKAYVPEVAAMIQAFLSEIAKGPKQGPSPSDSSGG